jgi:hypothetical protein
MITIITTVLTERFGARCRSAARWGKRTRDTMKTVLIWLFLLKCFFSVTKLISTKILISVNYIMQSNQCDVPKEKQQGCGQVWASSSIPIPFRPQHALRSL